MFYYKKGDIVRTESWIRPTSELFELWLNEWSKLDGIDIYDVYLTGAFCQNYFLNKNLDTWDIDIYLYSAPEVEKNYKALKHILDKGAEIGFKYNILIDIFWRNNIPTFNEFADGKIITYKEIIKKTDNEDWTQIQSCPYVELIPGLYYFDQDPIPAYNKFKSKNYEIVCKKLDL
jgi:hypothetical protein